MLSPQYTPFNGDEVALVLNLSPSDCEKAIRVGVLQRNVHFDARVSQMTALHSMVDIVAFGTMLQMGWPDVDLLTLIPIIDNGLDCLCSLNESGFFEVKPVDRDLLLNTLVRQHFYEGNQRNIYNEANSNLWSILADVWVDCMQKLYKIILSETLIYVDGVNVPPP